MTVQRNGARWPKAVAAIGTPIVMLGVAAAILLLPPVMNIGLELADSAAILGITPDEARRASELSVLELLIGPGTFSFAVTPGGPSFFGPTEAAHMRDVRVVVYAFFGLVLAGVLAVGLASRRMTGAETIRAVRLGAIGLELVVVAIAIGLVVAFDALFTLFHLIVFPGGNWMFDPTAQRIVQLYPTVFWEFAAGTLVGLSAGIGLVTIAATTIGLRRGWAAGQAPA